VVHGGDVYDREGEAGVLCGAGCGVGAMSAAVVGMKVFVALLISVWVYAVWLFRKNTVERMFL